jgi:glucuronate isomerase
MSETNESVAALTDEFLASAIDPVPVIDVHTHINGTEPGARDVTEIIFYHYIVSELEASGVRRATLEAAKSAEEKVDLFLESYKRLSNTITYWCLRRVLELHGIAADAELTREALLEANEKVQATHEDPTWPARALGERSHVSKTALTLSVTEEIPEFDSKIFFGTLRLDDLIGNVTAGTLGQFSALTGKAIDGLASFEGVARDCVAAFAKNGGKALSLGLPPEEDFVSADRDEAAKVLDRVLKGKTLDLPQRETLHSYLVEFFAGLGSDAQIPMQLLLGVRRPLAGNTAVTALAPGLVSRLAPLFHKFRGVSFDIFLASAPHSQEAIATAKNYPNITLSGFWWYAFSPPYIRAILTERLMALPAAKLHAFFSDAYNVEWSAGKLALLRRELARVLAELMVSHYLSESQAAEIAVQLLQENASCLYRL